MVLRDTCLSGIGQVIGDPLWGRQVGIYMFSAVAGHQMHLSLVCVYLKNSIFHADFESMILQEAGWFTQTDLGHCTKVSPCSMLQGQRSVGRGGVPDIPSESW